MSDPRWLAYLNPSEREDFDLWSGMLRALETTARERMEKDDDERRPFSTVLEVANVNLGTPDTDYGDDDAT